MRNFEKQPKDFIKLIQIIHIVLILGILLFVTYAAINTKAHLFFSYEEDRLYLLMAIIIAFAGNLSSKFLFLKLIKQIPADASLFQKATKYTVAHIFRIALLEFPALMCIILVLISNNGFYFIIVGLLVGMILVIFPTKNKFENELPLTHQEKSMLEKL